MKKIFLLILICLSTFAYSQTASIAKHKADKIFSYYNTHIVYRNHINFTVTDSIISMLDKDTWFKTLSIEDQYAKIWRLHYYQSKTVGKYKKNIRYLHTWDSRIFTTSTNKK